MNLAYILKKYGLTIDEYNAMDKSQNGKCAICDMNDTKRRLSIDHCHITGRIRGLLCNKCNAGIGLLGDNISVLENAINYLKRVS